MNDDVLSASSFGRLVQSSELSASPKMVVYEFVERIEAPSDGPGVLISHGADAYLQDMSMIVSLFFNCTCSPDIDLVRRLISGVAGTATRKVPQRLLRRTFDKDVFLQPDDSKEFVNFINQLLGLERKTYLGVMRAIRTYVTGLHRVADDLELAYTLMVAAGESLTQDFDGYESDWDSIQEKKRVPIDEALESAPAEVAERVREAVISIEHVALSRRFQEFVAANVSADYFEGNFEEHANPPGRSELLGLLEAAYKARSQYVHNLRQLPGMVSMLPGHVETVLPIEGRQRMLTLQGLARLIRDVIISFVCKQPVVDKESYDYHSELSGVVTVRLGSQAWIADTSGDISKLGRDRLEAFLEQFSGVPSGGKVTDISDLLRSYLSHATKMKADARRPYWVMLVLFNSIAKEKSVPISGAFNKLMDRDFKTVSAESLLLHAYLSQAVDCTIEEQFQTFQRYKKRRGNAGGIRFPRLFEAAIGLELAERYRALGQYERFRETATLTADDYPEHLELRASLKSLSNDVPISWPDILLPKRSAASTDSTTIPEQDMHSR
ncbi:hypothetical protein [Rugamonas apoptosis]|uniref:Uncharacterized protein n=1 Tax=Rugamonas apoptosis TaxID=2758570 RepID=A0A7W2F745_9BURK|nr:hypothetical protein [Rugamonas apoptosis]MBA5686337.1 hypothetical protein [Rugamonas apoptosis]